MDPKELLNDEAFKAQIENAKDIKEVVELLKSKGVEVTEEQIMKAMPPEGELNEDALEGVAGGRINWRLIWLILPQLLC